MSRASPAPFSTGAPAPKTPGWLDWHHNPAKPAFTLPPGAVDAPLTCSTSFSSVTR